MTTKADIRKLWEIQASGTACAVNLAAFLKAKAPRRKPKSSYRKAKESKALSRKGARADVRAACVERAKGRCEAGCGFVVINPLEMDHFLGRARSESIETCWMLCRPCHYYKTQNFATRAEWDEKFKAHCAKYGYPFRRRLTKSISSPATPSEAGIPPPVSVESAGCVSSTKRSAAGPLKQEDR